MNGRELRALLASRLDDAADAPRGDRESRSSALVAAAVLVPLVERRGGMTVLLTQRTEHLDDHPGQISFPGGRVEEGDTDPVATALREAGEEIGLTHRHVEVLGRLPIHDTVTGFRITPVVAAVAPGFSLKLDPFEVSEAFEVPLAFILDPHNCKQHSVVFEGRTRESYVLPYEGRFIWGATAGMLISLRDKLTDDDGSRPC